MEEPRRFQRAQFAVVLVLTSLNNTFERKCLVVPFHPDVLKLGRQTTAHTQAAPDNGYFDSRVLSRQHAEIWADYDSGKVYLHDAKSSNGTYINQTRLSPENTESEPFELKVGDLLDLGIDIMCNDESKQMYKKISARVDKVSMLPLSATNTALAPLGISGSSGSTDVNGGGSTLGGIPSASGPLGMGGTPRKKKLQLPPLNRNPSLETLKGEAIFGPLNATEKLALNHAHTTAGGQLVRDQIKQNVKFEMAAKRLVQQIREVKADTAKIQSVGAMLENIKRAAQQSSENDRRIKAQKMRASQAALKAENTRLKAQLHKPVEPVVKHFEPAKQVKPVMHNLAVLVGTSLLVTLIGIWIMFFFNPPVIDIAKGDAESVSL